MHLRNHRSIGERKNLGVEANVQEGNSRRDFERVLEISAQVETFPQYGQAGRMALSRAELIGSHYSHIAIADMRAGVGCQYTRATLPS